MLKIQLHKREVDISEAIENATDGLGYGGVIENLEQRVRLQNELIARMLKVQFGLYEEDFTDPEHYPQTDDLKLEFILGSDVKVFTYD